MAKLPPNPFKITAYYSGNTCIIDAKHHYQTCEVLCKLFDYHPEHDLALMRDELKSLLCCSNLMWITAHGRITTKTYIGRRRF